MPSPARITQKLRGAAILPDVFWPEEYPYTLNNGYYVVNLVEEP
ncbi:MAG: hypothetical protein ACLR23_15030 [Clostridia bacterium]